MLIHDCAHGSLFPSRRANELVGAVVGVLTPAFSLELWDEDAGRVVGFDVADAPDLVAQADINRSMELT